MNYSIEKIRDNIWAIEQKNVRALLLTGPDNAILVDSCYGGDILTICRSITDAPITLITTHSDRDHVGSDSQFPVQYMHSAEFNRYERGTNAVPQAKPLQEGDTFCVGQYQLEVIWVPGHTPGSIALLDRKHRFLISGDTVQTACIYLFGDERNLSAFHNSLVKLEALRQEGAFDTVFPSHGERIVPADILTDHLALTEAVLCGESTPLLPEEPFPDWFPDSVRIYRHGRAHMYFCAADI